MSDIAKKSIGFLIDELITADMKTWTGQERNFVANRRIESGEVAADDPEILREKADAADMAQKGNARRNQLMRAIDEYFNDENAPLPKTYTEKSKEIPSWVQVLTDLRDIALEMEENILSRSQHEKFTEIINRVKTVLDSQS